MWKFKRGHIGDVVRPRLPGAARALPSGLRADTAFSRRLTSSDKHSTAPVAFLSLLEIVETKRMHSPPQSHVVAEQAWSAVFGRPAREDLDEAMTMLREVAMSGLQLVAL